MPTALRKYMDDWYLLQRWKMAEQFAVDIRNGCVKWFLMGWYPLIPGDFTFSEDQGREMWYQAKTNSYWDIKQPDVDLEEWKGYKAARYVSVEG